MEKHPENLTIEQLQKQILLLEKENQSIRESYQSTTENYHLLNTSHQSLNRNHQALLTANESLEKQRNKLQQEVGYMSFQIEQMRRLLHGSKRERFISNEHVNQLTLPFETEDTPVKPVEEQSVKVEYNRPRYKKPHPGRTDFPAHLPVEEVVLEPNEDTQGMKCIGQEVTQKLDYVPAQLKVIKYIRNKYVAEEKSDSQKVIIADLPTFPIEKGIATAGLLAQVAVDKYVDHLPLYRQIERFKRDQVRIPPSTMDSWILRMSQLVEPLYEALRNKILGQGYLQVDETPIKVLDPAKKGKTHQGYYWVYHSPLQGAVFFDYQKGRGREGPRELLKDFTGYLQSDGYGVYEWFGKQDGIVLQGCMAHARRYFDKALDYDKQGASQVLSLIQKLYAIEREAREQNLSPAQRKELRLDKALPVANELGKLMASIYKDALPKSPMGQALAYSIARWDNLLNYLYDGSLEIDNNLVENAIRPNALGRKNYLFAGSHLGAQRAAMFYTFFGTCKMHGINPWQWMKKVLEVLPNHKANKLEELFPQNITL